jgi:hypothetical protein
MNHAELLLLIEEHERAEQELEQSRQSIWFALVEAEPELAAAILKLFSTVQAAAHWSASSLEDLGTSPAREVAEGRAAEIMSRVYKTMHGFVG